MRCLSYCFAEKLDLAQVESNFRPDPRYRTIKHRRVLEVIEEKTQRRLYVFSNGTLVGWSYRKDQLLVLIEIISVGCHDLFKDPKFYSDQFSYEVSGKTEIFPHEFFAVDCLMLESFDPELTLALSYGFSQSVKLLQYESAVDKLISKYVPLAHEVSESGEINLNIKKFQAIVSDVLKVKSDLNLTSNFLYAPKFFWKHPHLEEYFTMLQKYLDISERTEKLNEQLDTLNEIFEMYSNYLERKHSYVIEITILALIAVEVIFNVLDFLNIHYSLH